MKDYELIVIIVGNNDKLLCGYIKLWFRYLSFHEIGCL